MLNELKKTIIELLDEGYNVEEIADICQMSLDIVKQIYDNDYYNIATTSMIEDNDYD